MTLPRLPLVDDSQALLTSEQAARARSGSLAALSMSVGSLEFAVPLVDVLTVLNQLSTRPLPFGPPHLREMFDYGSRPVCVLDLGRALGERYQEPLQDRKLVVIAHEHLMVALQVDAVNDPEEFLATDMVRQSDLGGAEHGRLPQVLYAIARRAKGSLPIIDPRALLEPKLLSELSEAISAALAHAPSVTVDA